MPLIELEQLLAPVSAEAPAGTLLGAEVRAFERASEGTPERQIGEKTQPAVPPDYGAVLRQGELLLTRSKDLRVARHVARALVHRGGLEGLRDGLQLIRGLLERHWVGLHPELDPTDHNDPTVRASQISGAYPYATIAVLRTTPVLKSEVSGPISLQDLASGAGQRGSVATTLAPAAVTAALQEQKVPVLEALRGQFDGALEDIDGIEVAFATGTGLSRELANSDPPDPRWPRLSPLRALLQQASGTLLLRLGRGESQPPPEGPKPPDRELSGGDGEIRSREDVVRMLERICSYYERNEPTSPLPLILQRCRRLVSMSFVEIMTDLAPAGLEQLKLVSGKTEKSAEKSGK